MESILYRIEFKLNKLLNSMPIRDSLIISNGKEAINSFMMYLSANEMSIKMIYDTNGEKVYKKSYHNFGIKFTMNRHNPSIGLMVMSKDKSSISPNIFDEYFMDKTGFVYFIYSQYGYKIGMSYSINRRLKELKLTVPFDIKLHSYIECKNYKILEKQLHLSFADKKIAGEWFNLNENDFEHLDEYLGTIFLKRKII